MLVPSVTYTLLNGNTAKDHLMNQGQIHENEPAARSGHALHYSKAIGCSIMVGGLEQDDNLDDVWSVSVTRTLSHVDFLNAAQREKYRKSLKNEFENMRLEGENFSSPQDDRKPFGGISTIGETIANDSEAPITDRASRWEVSYEKWPNIPVERAPGFGFASCLFDGDSKLFIHGAVANNGELLDSPYVLDLLTREWSPVQIHAGIPASDSVHSRFIEENDDPDAEEPKVTPIGPRWGHSATLVHIPTCVAAHNGWFVDAGDANTKKDAMLEFIVLIGGEKQTGSGALRVHVTSTTADVFVLDPRTWTSWYVPPRKAASRYANGALQAKLQKLVAAAQSANISWANSTGSGASTGSSSHVDPHVPPPPPPSALLGHLENPFQVDASGPLNPFLQAELSACLRYNSTPLMLPPPRRRHSAAVHRDRFIVIFGGRALVFTDDLFRNDTWVFDTYQCLWHPLIDDLTPMEASNIFAERKFQTNDSDRKWALRDFEADLEQRLELPLDENGFLGSDTFGIETPPLRTGSASAMAEDGTMYIFGGFCTVEKGGRRYAHHYNELKGIRLGGPFTSTISPYFTVSSDLLQCNTLEDLDRVPPALTMAAMTSLPKPEAKWSSDSFKKQKVAYHHNTDTKYMLLSGGRIQNNVVANLYLVEIRDEIAVDATHEGVNQPFRSPTHNKKRGREECTVPYEPARIVRPLASACVNWFVRNIPYKDLETRRERLDSLRRQLLTTSSSSGGDESSLGQAMQRRPLQFLIAQCMYQNPSALPTSGNEFGLEELSDEDYGYDEEYEEHEENEENEENQEMD